MDYFTLFGLPATYPVDKQQLLTRFQTLQRQFHPDRFAASPERERMLAMQQATTINDAYQTLRHPLKSAEYLLALHGYDVQNEQQTFKDTAFLLRQLELREELDALEQQQDAAALSRFAGQVTALAQTERQTLTQLLADNDWPAAADSVRKLRFFDKLEQQITQLEERLAGY